MNSASITCARIQDDLTLYSYGELTQEGEELVEQHLAACTACAAELKRLRAFERAMTVAEVPVEPGLLYECRLNLTRAIRTQPARSKPSLSQRISSFMNMGVGIRVPAGALALVALGFLVGKYAPGNLAPGAGTQQAGFVNIRSVERDPNGNVKIAFDDVSRKTITGSLDDKQVRDLLLTSVHDESNAGLRDNAVNLMKDHAADADIRNALVDSLLADPNPGIRTAALEALRPYVADATVRQALTRSLLEDADAGVRAKVIDVLVTLKDQSLIGPLQTAVQKENNSYVRTQASGKLREMKASVGSF
jgi:hypothetical protein